MDWRKALTFIAGIVLAFWVVDWRALEALAQSEKLALIGQLSAGVAHEINNPLAVVLANASFIEREHDLSDAVVRGAFNDLHTGLQRIELIVRDLKSFSRADGVGPDRGST